MTTKNFKKLQVEVADHVKADRVAQRSYETCFIGCLANGINNPEFIENAYGIPLMASRIAESIFEGLPADEAPDFFAAIPPAIASDGKDLSRVGWKFFAEEMRSLPPVPDDIQACIDLVINGMDLLADGKEWPEATASAEADAIRAAIRATRAYTYAAADAYAAAAATFAAAAAAESADAAATFAYAAAAESAAAADAAVTFAAAHRRQRDTLLRLIKEAPITQEDS